MNRDLWVGVAWAGGLILAMAGVFAYSAATFELPEHPVTWSTATESREQAGSTLAAGASKSHSFDVEGHRVSAVEAVVTWIDTEGNNDRFKVELMGPADRANSAESDTGTATARVDINAVPANGAGRGFDDNATIDDADPYERAWPGTANWTVKVTLVAAPDATCPAACVPPAATDGSNSYAVTFNVVRYVGTVADST